ncbi:hypothetical protein HK405_005888 [Cladochytrium tenue]|nr:hypothetical protein HK405_005888 [Cladochytrium tenue]
MDSSSRDRRPPPPSAAGLGERQPHHRVDTSSRGRPAQPALQQQQSATGPVFPSRGISRPAATAGIAGQPSPQQQQRPRDSEPVEWSSAAGRGRQRSADRDAPRAAAVASSGTSAAPTASTSAGTPVFASRGVSLPRDARKHPDRVREKSAEDRGMRPQEAAVPPPREQQTQQRRADAAAAAAGIQRRDKTPDAFAPRTKTPDGSAAYSSTPQRSRTDGAPRNKTPDYSLAPERAKTEWGAGFETSSSNWFSSPDSAPEFLSRGRSRTDNFGPAARFDGGASTLGRSDGYPTLNGSSAGAISAGRATTPGRAEAFGTTGRSDGYPTLKSTGTYPTVNSATGTYPTMKSVGTSGFSTVARTLNNASRLSARSRSRSRPPAAAAKQGPTVSQLALLACCTAVYPVSWLASYLLRASSTACFSDVCDNATGTNPAKLATMLAMFYGFLLLSAAAALAAKLSPAAHRVLATRVVTPYSTVSLGEAAWFAAAAFLTLGACAGANWSDVYAADVATASVWTQGMFSMLMLLTGYSTCLAFGLVLLPAAKNSPVNDFLGLSYTATARVHTWLGYLAFATVVAHVGFAAVAISFRASVLTTFFSVAASRTGSTGWGNHQYIYLTGVVATFGTAYVTLTSLRFFRRRFYNFFYYSHFLVIVVLLFGYFHSSMYIFCAIPGLILWTIDGCIRLAARFQPTSRVTRFRNEPGKLRTFTVTTPLASLCRPGHFMRVCLPAVSALEFHPFTVARVSYDAVTFLVAPSRPGQWTHRALTHLEAAINFSHTAPAPVAARLQGPLGCPSRFAVRHRDYHSVAFYVAGTGAAPAFAILTAILEAHPRTSFPDPDAADDDDGGGFGAASTLSKFPPSNAGAQPPIRLYLFWSAAAAGLDASPLLSSLLREATRSTAALTVHLYDSSDALVAPDEPAARTLTRRPNNNSNNFGSSNSKSAAAGADSSDSPTVLASTGRPHLRTLLNTHLRDPAAAAAAAAASAARPGAAVPPPPTAGVFICGPDRFVQDAMAGIDEFAKRNRSIRVDLEVESYGL